jgi:ATP-dependent RNA helicase DeaD
VLNLTEFRKLNLKPELLESLNRIGFVSATEVQERAIPELLEGKNVIARAKTGTGKTAAFALPILQNIGASKELEAIVIAPTRELAQQIADFLWKMGKPLHVHTTTVYGGASMTVQINALRSGTNIVVGTPGRLRDLLERGVLKLDKIKFLVIDEADIMLDMGFIEDVEYIMSMTPQKKQMMMFSATIPQEIVRMAEKYADGEVVSIRIGEEEEPIVSTIKHYFAIVPNNAKFSALLAYIKDYAPKKAIIFARTKYEANAIHRILVSQGLNAILMHGGLTQSRREKSLGEFRGGAQFLIATNVAARGLDIDDITDIINFGAPEVNIYIHRVGRSARMGKDGRAITIATPDQDRELRDIEYRASVEMSQIKLNFEQFRNVRLPIHDRESGRFAGRGRPRSGRYREHEDRAGGRRRFSKTDRGGSGRIYLS